MGSGLALLPLVFALAAPAGQIEEAPLRGITTVMVSVKTSGPAPLSLSKDRLRAIVELRLRVAGLGMLSFDEARTRADIPMVVVEMAWIAVKGPDGITVGYAYSTNTRLQIPVKTGNGSHAPAVLWLRTAIHSSDRTSGAAHGKAALLGQIDELTHDWMEGNPRR